MTKPLSEADWKDMMEKSEREAQQWIKHNSQHLEKLKEWLHSEVKIVAIDTKGNTYTGNTHELIGSVNGMLTWICAFIEKIKNDPNVNVNVNQLINDTVLPYGHGVDTFAESKKQGMYVATLTSDDISYPLNLTTLCNKILELDQDGLTALRAMLCLHNDERQSLYDWKAWSMLADENRAKQGYKRVYEQRANSVGPWIKSSGGKRTKRHKKRSGHNRSNKRSGKRSGKRSNKSRRR